MARPRRLTAGEVGVLHHFLAGGGRPASGRFVPRVPAPRANPFLHVPTYAQLNNRQTHGTFVPELPTAAARAVAPDAYAPAPTIDRYGVVSGGILGLTAPEQLTGAPQTAIQGVLDNPQQAPPVAVHDLLQNLHVLGPVEKARVSAIPENLGEPADLTNAIVAAATLGGSAYLGTALKGGDAALGAAEGAGADAGGSAATQQVQEASRLVKAAQTGAKAATAPIRHPIYTAGAQVAAQAPQAIEQGSPNPFLHAIEGGGVLGAGLAGAGGGIRGLSPGAVPLNALADLVELPAQVLPSTYLSLKAGGNAVLGNPAELQALIKQFGQTSALAALAHGDVGGALSRAGQHPVYSLLEGLGVKAALGHGVGEVARLAGADGHARGTARPDINILDKINQRQGPYSTDYFANRRQHRQDARRPVDDQGRPQATSGEIKKYLESVVDREVFAGENVRRDNQKLAGKGAADVAPSFGGRNRGHFRSKTGQADDDVVALQAQGIISPDPAQARLDLAEERRKLIEAQPHLLPHELKVNRANVKIIDNAIAHADFDNLDTLRHHASEGARRQDELTAAGLLDHNQAEKSKAIPYAVRHMNSSYGISRADAAELAEVNAKRHDPATTEAEQRSLFGRETQLRSKTQHIDAAGDPLSTAAIHEHMRQNGFDPDLLTFVTQKTPSDTPARSVFYGPSNERASLSSKKRTGEAVRRGTHDFSYEALTNQAIHSQTIIDRVRNFDHFAQRAGLRAPDGSAFKSTGEALEFAEHPDHFGAKLPPVPGGYVPFRLAPFLSKKSVLEAVDGLGQNRAGEEPLPDVQTQDTQAGEEVLGKMLAEAKRPGDGPVVLIPKVMLSRFEQHFDKLTDVEKLGQATTQAFKGAVLPTSLSWFTGNAVDNWIVRAFGTGINPADIHTGKQFAKLIEDNLTPEQAHRALDSIIPGGLYGSVKNLEVHRDVTQFETSRLYPLIKAGHELLEAPGVKTVASAYRKYRDAVFHIDGHYVERSPQYGQLAKSARQELGLTRRRFRKAIAAGEPAITDLAKGFRNPDHVDYYAKQVENVFGNWGKNGPAARRYLTTWSPFWQWARAATKFAFFTLPKDHPILTSLIAAGEQMTRAEREKLGFDKFGIDPLPDYLQGSIPDPLGGEGGVANVGHLTTFGEFADPNQAFGSLLTPPVLAPAVGALGFGVDWKGDKLVNANGEPANDLESAKAAIFGTAESFIPFLNMFNSVTKKGAGGISPVKTYDAGSVAAQREPRQDISVPVTGGGSGSSSAANPFLESTSSSSAGNPFLESSGASSSSGNPFLGG